MADRIIYRKWYNPESEWSENYLLIHPSGLMLQISFDDSEQYGEKVMVFQSNKQNRLNPDVFKKHKQVCSKAEWDKAKRKALAILKGDALNLILAGKKTF